MTDTAPPSVTGSRRPVPRGIARSGPPVLSYGFRPFFLLAGLWALVAMIVWIGALAGWWPIGGVAGPIAWHAHEMLFGYGAAAACGFLLTAVPNWTGRLPVSGPPLAGLVALWLVGRLAMAVPGPSGNIVAAVLDCLFLPMLAAVVAREVVAGRNWKNLRVMLAISALAALNVAYHALALMGLDVMAVFRLTVGLFALLISLVGGRIIPSFTRNFLAKAGETRFPASASRFDEAVLIATLLAVLVWAARPETPALAGIAGLAALLQAVRLARWRGWAIRREPLLLVLHVGYAFVPIGLFALAATGLGHLAEPSALHVLTVGAIGLMTLAVMTRATRGHTGRPLTASPMTTASYAVLAVAALLRPLAEPLSAAYHLLLDASGLAFVLAFALYLIEYAPMLLTRSRG